NGISVQGGSGFVGGKNTGDSLVFQGSATASTPGQTLSLGGGGIGKTLAGFKALSATAGAGLAVRGSLQVDGTSSVTVSPGSSLSIAGNLVGAIQNPAQFAIRGAVTFNGIGTAAAPQLLEVMGRDLGNVPTAYVENFYFGSIGV